MLCYRLCFLRHLISCPCVLFLQDVGAKAVMEQLAVQLAAEGPAQVTKSSFATAHQRLPDCVCLD